MRSFWIALLAFVPSLLAGQDSLLLSGPMAGFHSGTEAILWLQTRQAATVSFTYWIAGDTSSRQQTPAVKTSREEAFTAKAKIEGLSPQTRYQYRPVLNGQAISPKSPLFFTTKPIDPVYDFKMVTGSCAYIHDEEYKSDRKLLKFGGRYGIFEKVADQQADYMLWLGDNVYLRDGDWNTLPRIHYRYTHSRSFPGLQRLLSTGHHVAIWDDHDFGPNDGNANWNLKSLSLRAFNQFWPNPTAEGQEGIYTRFRIADVEFFLLDVRYFRSAAKNPDPNRQSFLGREQFAWLIDALQASDATFKVMASGTQVFSNCNIGEGYCFQYPAEWRALMDTLGSIKVDGLVFLSGDKHYAEISRFDIPGIYPLYDITFSPMTSFPTPIKLKNTRRVRGTFYKRRNFGVLSFEGTGEGRRMKVELYNFKGKKRWERIVWAKALRCPR